MTNAAGQIWPHLRDNADPPKQAQRASSPLAQAMYPSLAPPQTKPDTWQERYLEMVGLRKIDSSNRRRK